MSRKRILKHSVSGLDVKQVTPGSLVQAALSSRTVKKIRKTGGTTDLEIHDEELGYITTLISLTSFKIPAYPKMATEIEQGLRAYWFWAEEFVYVINCDDDDKPVAFVKFPKGQFEQFVES